MQLHALRMKKQQLFHQQQQRIQVRQRQLMERVPPHLSQVLQQPHIQIRLQQQQL
jgi:hypothetical protein